MLTPHRYWDIEITATQGDVHAAINEIEMRATPGGADQCVGGVVLFSTQFNGTTSAAANAFDNNAATGWDSAVSAIPATIGYDFLVPVVVRAFTLTAHPTAARAPATFRLRYSDDGIAWTVLVTYSVPWLAGQVRSFMAQLDELVATKVLGYAVTGTPPDLLSSSKTLGYGVLGPGGDDLLATKVVAYAVLEEVEIIPSQIY